MIKKQNRGISKKEVERLLQQGRRTRLSGGFVCYRPSQEKQPRIAVSVAKRATSGAVGRNRIRRRIQAATRTLLTRRPINDYVLVWTDATDPSVEQLENELQLAFSQQPTANGE